MQRSGLDPSKRVIRAPSRDEHIAVTGDRVRTATEVTAHGRGERSRSDQMFGAAFMGVGAMVGAGIFALLGQAGAIAGTAVWISFLIAGAISNAPGLLLREARRSLPLQRWND